MIGWMRTRDGRWKIRVHEDQAAELIDAQGQSVLGRVPMYKVARRLAELGVSGDDLVRD